MKSTSTTFFQGKSKPFVINCIFKFLWINYGLITKSSSKALKKKKITEKHQTVNIKLL
jgi:hypothetical protein